MSRLYCNIGAWLEEDCIAIQKLYCDSRGSEMLDCVVTQSRDTASQAMTRQGAQQGRAGAQAGAGRRRHGRWARGALGARGAGRAAAGAGARGRQAWGVRGATGRIAWACCWTMGCALGALSLFLVRFDSVLFLSQLLDIVREPGS